MPSGCKSVYVCVCVWAERGRRLKSLLFEEAFASRCVQVALSAPGLAPLAHLSAQLPQSQRFVDMFTKHKQLRLHHIWACSGKGR